MPLVFALLCFFFVKEISATTFRFQTKIVTEAFAQVRHTVANARIFPGLVRFLIGRLFYAEAVNTLIIFMGIYVSNELGFSSNEVQILLLVSITAAVIGGFIFGPLVDRIGPKRSLNMVLIIWIIVLLGAIINEPSLLNEFISPSDLVYHLSISNAVPVKVGLL